jgi:thiopeptide-type bacteriocin biosynthesis protein
MATGAVSRFAFDTYDREIERFGGPQGMTVSESLFYSDSVAAAELVRVLKSKQRKDPDERTALFALSVDDLLGGVGFDAGKCLDWYKRQAVDGSLDSGPEYRKLKNLLRAVLGDPLRWLAEKPFGEVIEAALTRRRQDLSEVSREMRQLDALRLKDKPIESLCSSYTHLHLKPYRRCCRGKDAAQFASSHAGEPFEGAL